jgi:hypothetical protein|nr:MAG TPA: growth factor-like protein [Caudoviricetes sp.]
MKCKFEHDGDCCNSGSPQYMCKCKPGICGSAVPMTNADRIRAMSDKELARFLAEVENRRSAAGGGAIWNGMAHALEWLQQPPEEG